jgi:hypothetical protein
MAAEFQRSGLDHRLTAEHEAMRSTSNRRVAKRKRHDALFRVKWLRSFKGAVWITA